MNMADVKWNRVSRPKMSKEVVALWPILDEEFATPKIASIFLNIFFRLYNLKTIYLNVFFIWPSVIVPMFFRSDKTVWDQSVWI